MRTAVKWIVGAIVVLIVIGAIVGDQDDEPASQPTSTATPTATPAPERSQPTSTATPTATPTPEALPDVKGDTISEVTDQLGDFELDPDDEDCLLYRDDTIRVCFMNEPVSRAKSIERVEPKEGRT